MQVCRRRSTAYLDPRRLRRKTSHCDRLHSPLIGDETFSASESTFMPRGGPSGIGLLRCHGRTTGARTEQARPISGSGHSRPNWAVCVMSGLPRSRPLGRTSRIGSFVPETVIAHSCDPSHLDGARGSFLCATQTPSYRRRRSLRFLANQICTSMTALPIIIRRHPASMSPTSHCLVSPPSAKRKFPVPIFWTCRASSPTGANATGL
jgi:hypothetical protein